MNLTDETDFNGEKRGGQWGKNCAVVGAVGNGRRAVGVELWIGFGVFRFTREC